MGFGHWPELLLIMVIALIVFGPSKLPEVGNAVGSALREFRRATGEIEDAVMRHSESPSEPEPDYDAPADSSKEQPAGPAVDTLSLRRMARQTARDDAEVASLTSDGDTLDSG